VSGTLAGLALHSRLKINEKEIPKNLQSTIGGAVTKEWKESKAKKIKTTLRNIINVNE